MKQPYLRTFGIDGETQSEQIMAILQALAQRR